MSIKGAKSLNRKRKGNALLNKAATLHSFWEKETYPSRSWNGTTALSQPRTREQISRKLNTHLLGTNFQTGVSYYYSNPSYKKCVDEVHVKDLKTDSYRSGGPFDLRRYSVNYFPSANVVFCPDAYLLLGNSYSGKLIPTLPFGFPNPKVSASKIWQNLGIFGGYNEAPAKGWRKFRPGNQDANLAQFLGELNRIPTIPLQLKNLKSVGLKNYKNSIRLKQIGDDYLNVVFGWLPFVRDLQAMYELYHDLGAALKQLRRDNGKRIHRKGSIVKPSRKIEFQHEYADSFPHLYPGVHSFFFPGPHATVRTDVSEESSWFSGTFEYWIPNIDHPRWPAEATRALFGANLTPSLAWELMPWSWLIDWFTNVGDILSNLSANAADNLVAHYAYTMWEKKYIRSYTSSSHFLLDCSPVKTRISATVTEEWSAKTRRATSPYGPEATPATLSLRQVAILGALGLSRLL